MTGFAGGDDRFVTTWLLFIMMKFFPDVLGTQTALPVGYNKTTTFGTKMTIY